MDALFAQLCEQHTPKVNEHVMNGLACLYMRSAETYVDSVFRSASASFPLGLEYLGYERCSPISEYEELTKIKNNKCVFDLAKSDIYLVKYNFAFNGEPIPGRYIFLPYVNDAAIFSLGGAKYHITPVLSDKVISPGYDSVFVRLLRDKIIFKRCLHSLVINNVRENTYVVWAPIYRKPRDNKKVPITTKANTCIAHYLFAKYGFTEVFKRYAGVVPDVGEAEINTDNYPADKWVICESSQVKPKTFMSDFYTPTEIRLAIPIDKWNSNVKSLVVGFFYVVDHFPTRLKPAFLDNISLWMILLGHIIRSGAYGENKLYSNVQEHFTSLDDYVDTIIIEKLRECNYNITNFYDLLAMIISNFNNLILENGNATTSMFGKSLEVLYYMLYDITASIFNVNYRLGNLAVKRTLTMSDVVMIFNRNMTPGSIFKLTSRKTIIESVSYSGDHKYPKITSKITEQESSPGATHSKSKRLVVGPDKHLDISMIEAGSILYLSKSNPSPTNRINPFVMIDIATGTIIRNPKFNGLRDETEALLKGLNKN